MSHAIETYLSSLRSALAAADPAVVHDALYDAEEYLRTELSAALTASQGDTPDVDAVLAGIIDAYGTPEEVAAAYLEAESAPQVGPTPAAPPTIDAKESAEHIPPARTMPVGVAAASGAAPTPGGPAPAGTSVASSASWASFFGVMTDRRTWLSLAYMLIALGTGIVYFTWVVTGWALSLGLAALIIGIPFALFFLASIRGISFAEGRLVELLLGVRMPRRPSFGPSDPSIVQRILYWLRDRRTWTAMLYLLLQLPLGVAYFVIAVTGLVTSVSLLFSPLAYAVLAWGGWTVDGEPITVWTIDGTPLPSWMGPLAATMAAIVGVLLLFGTLHLIRLIGRFHGAYAKAMLVRRAPESAQAGSPATPSAVATGRGGQAG